MSEMVERVARAIALASLDDETRAVVDPETWPVANSYYDMAIAAIEAMRMPTKEMEGTYLVAGGLAAEDLWPAMIDAALK